MLCLLIVLYTFSLPVASIFFFFFNDTATTEIYTLSLHDALPILTQHANWWPNLYRQACRSWGIEPDPQVLASLAIKDRKSTRLNSSHANISYAVFCLKKKKKKQSQNREKTDKQTVESDD